MANDVNLINEAYNNIHQMQVHLGNINPATYQDGDDLFGRSESSKSAVPTLPTIIGPDKRPTGEKYKSFTNQIVLPKDSNYYLSITQIVNKPFTGLIETEPEGCTRSMLALIICWALQMIYDGNSKALEDIFKVTEEQTSNLRLTIDLEELTLHSVIIRPSKDFNHDVLWINKDCFTY